jgi:nitrogen fixation/metabolism regulation signal transduction histidine kinase
LWIVGNPLFFSQYWLFACKYSRTAYEVPIILDGRNPEDEQPKCCIKKSTQTIILLAIIISSALNGFFYAIVHSGSSSQQQAQFYFVFVGTDSILILYIGIVLIDSVITIRKALRDRQGSANLKQMAIHAFSFGLFVTSFIGSRVVLFYTCFDQTVG